MSTGEDQTDRDTPVTFVVVDDDPAIRHLVTVQARRTPQVELIGRADDGASGIGVVATLQPDLVLLDLVMPTSGVEVLPALRQVAPGTALLAWSADADALEDACAAGADGGVHKVRSWPEVAQRMVRLASAITATDDTPLGDGSMLRRDEARLVGAEPFIAPVSPDDTWPCPSCSDERPLVGAWALDVADPSGGRPTRRVLVCALCAEAHGVTPMPASG